MKNSDFMAYVKAHQKLSKVMNELEQEGLNRFRLLECIIQDDSKFSDENMTIEEKNNHMNDIQIYKNILIGELSEVLKYTNEVQITSKMYTRLFNEVTDIKNELYKLAERMNDVQVEVEEVYINQET